LAASEGLPECVESLVRAGADTGAQDNQGHTPLDLARIWCHRNIARFLKDSIWQKEKKTEMERHRDLQNLQLHLINMHRRSENGEKVAREKLMKDKVKAWANNKGLPLLWPEPRAMWNQAHVYNLSPDQKPHSQRTKARIRQAWNISPDPHKPPSASVNRLQHVRLSCMPETRLSEPDLRQSVALCRARGDGQPQYTTKWDSSPQPAPNLPRDVLQRGLFPAAFQSRIASP
ncbi:hypothetical protein DPEC_G00099500, partial [Dallia pectoralis]